MPHAACPRPGSRPELSRSQKTAAANICSFVIQDCCAVDIHWGPEQRQRQQLKLQVVVAHCAIKAKAAGSEEKTAAVAAAIEENPSLISPKVVAGSKNKGQNGQPEGERERERDTKQTQHALRMCNMLLLLLLLLLLLQVANKRCNRLAGKKLNRFRPFKATQLIIF